MAELVSKSSVLDALKSGIPDAEWLLGQIESEHGWLRFPPFLSGLITRLKIENYPLLYASENAMAVMFLKGWMSDDEIREFNTEMEAASPDERGQFLADLTQSLSNVIEHVEIPKAPEDHARARKMFDAMSPGEQSESIRQAQHFYGFFLASFYQNLSIMVHGERLTALVAQAKQGSDSAFVRAVQIDKRILIADPYFSERYARAQMEPPNDFYDALSYRLRAAPYKGKIRHKSLWLAFSILERTQLLDELSYREIMEMCDEAGVGGYENRIQSEKHLGSRLREYREFQKRGVVTTT